MSLILLLDFDLTYFMLSLWRWPDGLVWRVTRRVTEKSRRVRFALFMRVMKPGTVDRVLDVGAGEGVGAALNFFEAWYPWKRNITAVALEDLPAFRQAYPDIRLVLGDGRRLSFSDKSFDIYFSNAVLEHVGTLEDQRRFVAEACRVAKRVFLSTPNKWFPVDAHTMIPFAHWLPLHWRNAIYRTFGREFYASEERLRLLGRRDIERLIPHGFRAIFYAQRTCGLISNWNVVIEARKT